MENVIVLNLDILLQIYIIRGNMKQMITVLLADPEDKSAVRKLHIPDHSLVVNVGRDQDQITILQGV